MTSRSDDDSLPQDPRFDRAWRAASAEEPPAALDDALRAAARRAVGAQPRRVAPEVKAATRPERWWFPLAAAATIGAIAFGLLQIVGQDRLAGETAPTGVVSDVAAPASAPAPGAESRTPAPAAIAPPPQPIAASPPDTAGTGTAAAAPPRERAAEASTPGPASRSGTSRPVPASTAVPPPPQPATDETTAAAREAASAAAASPATVAPPPAPAPAPVAAFVRAPQPFPAAKTRDELHDAVPAPLPAPAPPAPARALLAQPAGSATGSAAAPPAASAASPSAPRSVERAVASTKRADAVAGAPPRDSALASPLPVAEWIALIRRLRDEGRLDEARREIVAFRKAHADHAQLLPPDLRDWAVDPR